MGVQVASFDHKRVLDLDFLSTGLYYINFVSSKNKEVIIKRIIKK